MSSAEALTATIAVDLQEWYGVEVTGLNELVITDGYVDGRPNRFRITVEAVDR
jgi:hypothetical protein